MSPPFARFQYYGNPLTVMKGWAAVLATAFVTYQGVKYALYHSRRQSLLEIREQERLNGAPEKITPEFTWQSSRSSR